jgi:ribose/xylose/arabinose/galactoside ABC-type transport system permease subunit
MMGALAATSAALLIQDQPGFLILVVGFIAATIAGGLWGFIPGFLKARTGAHEVITTIMLNYVAAQIVLFGLVTPFIQQTGSGQPVSKLLSGFVDVPLIIDLPAIRLDYGFVAALVMAAVVSFLLFRTTKGFELRAAGFNLTAARYAGMSAGGSMMLAMFLSGARRMGSGFLVLGRPGAHARPRGRHRLQRDRAGPPGRASPERGGRRGAPVRGADQRRQADGHRVRDPVRPAVVHLRPRDHVRGRTWPDPDHLANPRPEA